MPPFIHLRARSAYSLLEGAIKVKDLVGTAAQQRMPALALTDNGNLFGSLEFSLAAADNGVQPIVGCLLSLKSLDESDIRGSHYTRPADQLLVLAKDATGYANLLKLVSQSYLAPVDGQAPLLAYADLCAHQAGLIVLTAGPYGAVGRQLASGRYEAAEKSLLALHEVFGDRLYVELMRHGLEIERRIEPELIELAFKHGIPLVATNDIYFANVEMFEAHDALLCVADGRYITETNRRRLTPEHRFKTTQEMQALFADIPEAVTNTAVIAQRCTVMARPQNPILPQFDLAENEALQLAARKGLEQRLIDHVFTEGMSEEEKKRAAAPYRERLEFELDVIIGMKFPGYFLIVSDFITWSKRNGIPVGPGRGSGAGSVVAWALLITDLDPLRYGLLFERFLNPERISMPDFDVDFCQDRRDEVIRYVQEKYGADRVAQIITFGKLQARAVLRDVGRVLQMPYGQVDKICKMVPNNPAAPVTLQQAINIEPMFKAAIAEDETVAKLVDIALKLEGLYRHASTHAAGVVIADRPLEELVPLYRDPKSDMRVVQYSMKYAESAGLVKFDFLGLKTLTVLVKAVEMLKRRDIHIDLLKLPEGDPKTYEMLSSGDTLGVFQLESAGMRDTLRKLKPDCLEDIIALVSLYRPGPMDNIPTYIARKHGEEQPEYLHPKLAEVLKETFGVIIYQEQVMQIAQLLAGYSLGEADLLRRAMGKKIKSEMEAHREGFVVRAMERGVAKPQAKAIFDLIAKFAEYGFNKSHAAAYALIAYQTAYIKANFPVEFLAASMSYDMHHTDKLGVFRTQASRYGIALLPPDVNASGVQFAVEQQKNGVLAIRYALAALKNVGVQAMEMVVEEREAHGPFKTLFDFASRLDVRVLNRRQMEHLVKAGAFDSLNPNRKQVFEAIDTLIAHSGAVTRDRESSQGSLFGGGTAETILPKLPECQDWLSLEKLDAEYAAIGFYLSAHPLTGYEKSLTRAGVTVSGHFGAKLGGNYGPVKVAGIVTGKKIRVSERGRFAFVQLSDTEGVFEVAIFDEKLLNAHRDLLENGNLLIISADGKMEETGPRLIAQSIAPLGQEFSKADSGEVRIGIASADPLVTIKQLLGVPSAQGMKIRLEAPLDNGKLGHVSLPGHYSLTPAAYGQIRHMHGVTSLEEI